MASAAVVLIAATGCGGGTGDATGAASPTGRTDTTTPAAARHLTVTSTAYRDGGTVPRRFTCDGADVSTPLALSGVPAGTRSLGPVRP
ncbi:hypothetical protein [Streptomyces sp. NPDC093018]|uniref:hypothetical protein n=1 Tax=Streptomyces sp. NPDC093018 TaxID=3155067 RepID=UPI003415DB8E